MHSGLFKMLPMLGWLKPDWSIDSSSYIIMHTSELDSGQLVFVVHTTNRMSVAFFKVSPSTGP